jgi:hypothetical protein
LRDRARTNIAVPPQARRKFSLWSSSSATAHQRRPTSAQVQRSGDGPALDTSASSGTRRQAPPLAPPLRGETVEFSRVGGGPFGGGKRRDEKWGGDPPGGGENGARIPGGLGRGSRSAIRGRDRGATTTGRALGRGTLGRVERRRRDATKTVFGFHSYGRHGGRTKGALTSESRRARISSISIRRTRAPPSLLDALRRQRSGGPHATLRVAAPYRPPFLNTPAPGNVRAPIFLTARGVQNAQGLRSVPRSAPSLRFPSRPLSTLGPSLGKWP